MSWTNRFWAIAVLMALAGCTINAPVREYHYNVHMERSNDVEMSVFADVPNKKDEIRQDTRPTTEVDASIPMKVIP